MAPPSPRRKARICALWLHQRSNSSTCRFVGTPLPRPREWPCAHRASGLEHDSNASHGSNRGPNLVLCPMANTPAIDWLGSTHKHRRRVAGDTGKKHRGSTRPPEQSSAPRLRISLTRHSLCHNTHSMTHLLKLISSHWRMQCATLPVVEALCIGAGLFLKAIAIYLIATK